MGRLKESDADVIVIGGGVIGVTTALELAASGRSVRVLEEMDFADGTSHGNAGLLCPSYATPLASPKALVAALMWLLRREGPFTLAMRPWSPTMASWLARFVLACRPERLRRSTQLLAELARRSIAWYDAFSHIRPGCGLRRDGWLYVFRTASGYADGRRHAQAVGNAGVAWNALSAREAVHFEPALCEPAGAIFYPGDAHLDPHAYLESATSRARELGVDLLARTRVLSIVPETQRVRIVTDQGVHDAGHVVLAAGSWTVHLARALGVSLPILSARGHSASLRMARSPRIPLMLDEAHVVVTPMGERVRMTSGLELGSCDALPNPEKLRTMAEDVGGYVAENGLSFTDGWVGFRPLTPDSLPIIGPLSRCPRVVVASGHGTLGMTLAPATAQLVRGIIEGAREPSMLSPRRFGG